MRLLLLLAVLGSTLAFRCPREPTEEQSGVLKSPGDNDFRILVSGEPEQYVPGAVYTLSIVGSRTHGRLQMFSRFTLGVEPLDPNGDASPQRVGSFQLFGDSLTTFNDRCINTISETDDLAKTEVQVMWISPPKGSGCIVFRAMVLEDRDNWYADDGGLSRQLCELTTVEKQTEDEENQAECCACDEAKYTMVFEGLWSNVTHPKDFPFSLWLTHFSDVIGASHEHNFSFWGEGQIATDGLRMVAEWGSVRGMESELRANSKHLRTLIKAAGLWYPNVNTNTSSSFRVDQRRPLLSLVSMLGPTPDWIVGVSGLNLCMRNCTWTEQTVVDLFPWDAGTDGGITYMSPNSPTIPRERIHRITTMYPEDPRAPFYNPTGGEMKPLARLYITRESIIPRSCDEQSLGNIPVEQVDVAENTEDTSRPECAVSDYTEWSVCSVTCGKGLRLRQRTYINSLKAEMLGCNRQLVAREMCVASNPTCPDDLEEGGLIEEPEGICATTDWSSWSECSVSCGVGVSTRNRHFVDRMGHKKCPHVSVMQKEKCMQPKCTGVQEPSEIPDPMCPVTEWSDWSQCSASCGKGVKLRTRLLLVEPSLQEKCSTRLELWQQRPCEDKPDCTFDMATAKQVCMLEPEIGPCRGYFERWYFEPQKGMCVPFGYGGCRGNRNNFLTANECSNTCDVVRALLGPSTRSAPSIAILLDNDAVNTGAKTNCAVTEWGPWSICSATCGHGFKERTRSIIVWPANGGKSCPKRMIRRKKCHSSPCE